MSDEVRILGVAGSLRAKSYNRAALRAAQQLVPEGTALEIFEGIGEFPHYDEDLALAAFPTQVTAFKDAIKAADGVLFVTPEYNHGIPGVLKNALDWAGRPAGDSAWLNKPTAIMAVSTGPIGGPRGVAQLKQNLAVLGTYNLNRPEVLVTNAREKFDEDLEFTDATGRDFMQRQLQAFTDWIRKLR